MDVNVRNQNIESPLLSALRLRNKEISLNLMSKLVVHPNVDVNLPDYHGDTPLHEAVKNETSLISEVILTTLLRNPTVKINVKNYLGETPLHVAKTVAAARQLVEKGADINRRDGSYNTPLHKQVRLRKFEDSLSNFVNNRSRIRRYATSSCAKALKSTRGTSKGLLLCMKPSTTRWKKP